MKLPEGGFAAVAYGPCSIKSDNHGVPVSIEVETDYPFSDEIKIIIHTPQAIKMPFLLRIPDWLKMRKLW